MHRDVVNGIIQSRKATDKGGLTRACFDARHFECRGVTTNGQPDAKPLDWCGCRCHQRYGTRPDTGPRDDTGRGET